MRQNRRQFMQHALAAVAAAGASRLVSAEEAKTSAVSLEGVRFLTFNTVIRVNQIEAGRDQLIGNDEGKIHSPETARQFRAAFERGWPGGRMTWAFSWWALQDKRDNYKAIREFAVECHHKFGDDITFIPGGYFANMYNTREQVNADLHDALAMVSEIVGGGYRPQSVVAGYLAADNLRFLAEKEGIHVCQGNIWSQYAVDNGDGDGSICYPYYPSREHFCKPAQGEGDFIDCVNLDGWTCDFLAARRAGCTKTYNSRMGMGPIETFMRLGADTGMKEVMATTAAHFDAGFDLNKFGAVTTCWELSLFDLDGGKDKKTLLECLPQWLEKTRTRWPKSCCVTQGEFGNAWRAAHKDNTGLDYRFVQRGSGVFGSDENLEIRWFMNRDFRLALLRDWKENGPQTAIDFTRYDLKAEEPKDKGRNWSLMNRLNQKGIRPQDKPVALKDLNDEERSLIKKLYPELI